MTYYNVAILGEAKAASSLAKKLGKKGTVSDLELYNEEYGDDTFTFFVPKTFPEKIQQSVECAWVSGHVLIVANSISKELGELLILCDHLGHLSGTIVLDGVSKEELKPFLNGIPASYELIENDPDAIIARIKTAPKAKYLEGPMITIIDHAFPVKGIGTVVLGTVTSGTLRIQTKARLLPQDIEVTIRSIQVNDKDKKEAQNSRVGLALKGVDAEELERGFVITDDKEIKPTTSLTRKVRKSEFYNKELVEGMKLHAVSWMDVFPITLTKVVGDLVSIEAEKPFTPLSNGKLILLDINNQGLRVVGNTYS